MTLSAILHQFQIMLLANLTQLVVIGNTTIEVNNHHSLGFRSNRFFNLININLKILPCRLNQNGYEIVLRNREDGCNIGVSRHNDFISKPDKGIRLGGKVKWNTDGLDLVTKRGYYRGYFNINKVGDTFLNFETWGKGQVWVNGHAMGRIWSIGPQQTLYIPGCWLKKGKNEIIVLDVVGPKEAICWGQSEPELNKLQLEKTNKHNNIGDKPDLNSATPVALSVGNGSAVATTPSAVAKAGNGWQTFRFAAPQKGRYLAIEVLSTQSGKNEVAIAEIYALNADGQRLSRESWTTKYANSEEENGNHTGDKVFDLQESTYWQTERGASAPHLLVIDLGSIQTITALEYLPRAEQGAPGSIKDFKVYMW